MAGRLLLLGISALLVLPSGARGQQARDDAAAVREVIDRVFMGMAQADSALVRSGFHDGARFAVLRSTDGASRVQYMPIDGWLSAIAGSGQRWVERIYDVAIQVDGDMASAWTPYTFYLDGKVRHCGINSIELLRSGSEWRITQLSDTRRAEDCPDPGVE